MATTKQDLGSNFGDETLITAVGTRGTLPVNNNSDSIASISDLNEPVSNE